MIFMKDLISLFISLFVCRTGTSLFNIQFDIRSRRVVLYG